MGVEGRLKEVVNLLDGEGKTFQSLEQFFLMWDSCLMGGQFDRYGRQFENGTLSFLAI